MPQLPRLLLFSLFLFLLLVAHSGDITVETPSQPLELVTLPRGSTYTHMGDTTIERTKWE